MSKSLTPEEIEDARKLLAEYESKRPDVVSLAMLSSLARRIEPEVLRELRLELADRLAEKYSLKHRPTVATEAALWFSPLLESRGPDNITLLDEFSHLLRERLKEDQELLDKAHEIIDRLHQSVSPVILWEEDLVYLSLRTDFSETSNRKEFERKVWQAIKAIETEERPGLEQWIMEMGVRLPKAANLNLPLAYLYDLSSSKARERSFLSGSKGGSGIKLDYSDIPTRVLEVQMVGNSFRLGFLNGGGRYGIKVPDLLPIHFYVLQTGDQSDLEELRVIPRREFIDIPVGPEPVKIRTIDGKIYLLDQQSFETPTVSEIPHKNFLQPSNVLKGHKGLVWALAITPDNNRLISGSYDGTLIIWDLNSGKPIRTLLGHTDRIFGVLITPDGRSAISCSADGTLVVSDLESGNLMAKLKGHELGAYCVAAMPDGHSLISGSFDHTLMIWNYDRILEKDNSEEESFKGETGKHPQKIFNSSQLVAILKGHTDSVFSVAITTDGRYAVSASADRTLRVWDLGTKECTTTLIGHSEPVDHVAITRDGNWIISGSRDKTVRIWNLVSGKLRLVLKGHDDAISGLTIVPNGLLAITCSFDKTMRFWDLANGTCEESIELPIYPVNIAITSDLKRVILSSDDSDVWLWDIPANLMQMLKRSSFSQAPYKDQTWQELIRLTQTQDEDNGVLLATAEALEAAFSQVPDKTLAWLDLHRLTRDKSIFVRQEAAKAIGAVFSQVPDKTLAWQDLHRLTGDEDSSVRWRAVNALGAAFRHVPDKTQAWQDLHRLTGDEYILVRFSAAEALGAAFSQLPDKTLAWLDLQRLAEDEDSSVRRGAADALGAAFSQVPDKTLAWLDLQRLAEDEDSSVRQAAADALGAAFSQLPDKTLAWLDLHRLMGDEDSSVRRAAADALGAAFSQVPDKTLAWLDLHRLMGDEDSSVRWGAASALGAAFSQVSDKALAWQDLIRLTGDEYSDVRMEAYHSLGRASIFKATESADRDAVKKELEAAIEFFEKSSQESAHSPAKFCGPFYRSYFAIAFQEAKEDEVQRYLAEAKEAVGGSEIKEELLLAVENLAKALQESQKLKGRSLEEIASELNDYRWYCDKAASHMATAQKGAPEAVELMRKINPVLEEYIQAPIAEIQKMARQIFEITRGSGSSYEAPGTEIYRAAEALSADDFSSLRGKTAAIVWQLKEFCRLLPPEDREQVCEIVEKIEHEPVFPEKLNKIKNALLYFSQVLADKSTPLADVVVLTTLPEEYSSIRDRLSELGPPPDMGDIPNLYAWRFGKVSCQNLKADYKIAVGMIGRAGTTEGALAAREAVQLWRPRYVIFCGIAGGLPDPKERNSHPRLGDVVVADIIYGYEYGKLERKFKPRANCTYRADQALLTGSMAYSLSDGWRELIRAEPPRECTPQVVRGEIASGDQVVDDPSNDFFAQVLKAWPRINAVEMEGAGAAAAIDQAGSLGIPTRFMMIRGISDLPRAKGKNKGRKERDAWKAYASDVAAAFIMGWITDGLPLPPSSSFMRGDRLEDIERAIEHYNQALKAYTQKDFPNEWVETENNLANAYLERIRGDRAENIEQAIQHFQQALIVRTREEFPVDWAETENNLANAYLERIRGDRAENIEQAIEHCRRALEVYTEKDFLVHRAMSLNNLGTCLSELGRRDEALISVQWAVDIRRELAQANPAFLPDLAMSLNNLGTCLSELGRRDEAHISIQEAVDIRRKIEQSNPDTFSARPGYEPQKPWHPPRRSRL